VQCAHKCTRNSALTTRRKKNAEQIHVRIGIHLGDIVNKMAMYSAMA